MSSLSTEHEESPTEIAEAAYKKALAGEQFDLLIKMAMGFHAMVKRNPEDEAARKITDEIFLILGETFPVTPEPLSRKKDETLEAFLERKQQKLQEHMKRKDVQEEQMKRKDVYFDNINKEKNISFYNLKKNQFIEKAKEILYVPKLEGLTLESEELDKEKEKYSKEKEKYSNEKNEYAKEKSFQSRVEKLIKEIPKPGFFARLFKNKEKTRKDFFDNPKTKEKFKEEDIRKLIDEVSIKPYDEQLKELRKAKEESEKRAAESEKRAAESDKKATEIYKNMNRLAEKGKAPLSQSRYTKFRKMFEEELYQPAFLENGKIARSYDPQTLAFLIQGNRTLEVIDSLTKKGFLLELKNGIQRAEARQVKKEVKGKESIKENIIDKIVEAIKKKASRSIIENLTSSFIKEDTDPEMTYLEGATRAVQTSKDPTKLVRLNAKKRAEIEEKKRAEKKRIDDEKKLAEEQRIAEERQEQERIAEKRKKEEPAQQSWFSRTFSGIMGAASYSKEIVNKAADAIIGKVKTVGSSIGNTVGSAIVSTSQTFTKLSDYASISFDFAGELFEGFKQPKDAFQKSILKNKMRLGAYTLAILNETLNSLKSLKEKNLIRSEDLIREIGELERLLEELDKLDQSSEKNMLDFIDKMVGTLGKMTSHKPPFVEDENPYVISLITLTHGAMERVKEMSFYVNALEHLYSIAEGPGEYKTLEEALQKAAKKEEDKSFFAKILDYFTTSIPEKSLLVAAKALLIKIDSDTRNQMQALVFSVDKIEADLKKSPKLSAPVLSGTLSGTQQVPTRLTPSFERLKTPKEESAPTPPATPASTPTSSKPKSHKKG